VDDKLINAVSNAVTAILQQFGISDIRLYYYQKRESNESNYPINITIGFLGEVNGYIIFGFNEFIAEELVSIMTGGFINALTDTMGRSTILELGNMLSAYVATNLAFEIGSKVEITPPTMVMGKDIYIMMTRYESIDLKFTTDKGSIGANISIWQKG